MGILFEGFNIFVIAFSSFVEGSLTLILGIYIYNISCVDLIKQTWFESLLTFTNDS
jgi:hypothetical protein